MKTLAFSLLCAVAATQVSAQVFRPETVSGAVLGGVAGAVIGNNSGDLKHNAWKGAAIGTVAGALIGSAVGDAREQAAYNRTQVPVPVMPRSHYYHRPDYYYGYDHGYRNGPIYYDRYDRGPYRDYTYSRAGTGLLLGGIAGAVIGHNSGDLRHNAWRGAAIGAGTGWLLGSIADNRARERAALEEARREVAATQAAQASAQPTQVTIINNYYNTPATPMSSANGMFGR